MKKTKLILMAALLGGLLAGCQPIEEIDTREIVDENAGKDGYTLTIEAVKSMGTKAMALENDALNTYWKSGEKVGLYVNGVYKCQLTATPKANDNTKATLSGTLASLDGITEGKTMTLLYPDREDITEGSKWDYTGQTGEAPNAGGTGDLSAKYDYATATLTVTGVNGSQVTTSGVATFQNEQSMFRFIFNDGQATMTAKSITVSSANETLVRSLQVNGALAPTPTYGSITLDPSSIPGQSLYTPTNGYYYFSLRNEMATNTDTFKFSLVGEDDKLYSGTKAITSKLSYGKFYSPDEAITVTATAFLPINTPIEDPNAVL